MEWSIQDLARAAGTTSRTLRHYGSLGLLAPSRVGANGYRYYDRDALVRLQRILLLRELGLGLPAIAEVFAGAQETTDALRIHLELLEQERARIERQIASVRTTLDKTEGGEELMVDEVFDGFDHTQYEAEVVRRWGRDAYQNSSRWWSSMSQQQQQAFQQQHLDIAADYGSAHAAGATPDSEQVQQIAARHVAWLSGPVTVTRDYVANIGDMYLADDRFGHNYERHGAGTTQLVSDALKVYAQRNL